MDFDGQRLAVAAGGCVWSGDVDESLAGPPGGLCPQAVTGDGRRRARRGGSRFAYTFPCLMAPARGCRGGVGARRLHHDQVFPAISRGHRLDVFAWLPARLAAVTVVWLLRH